VNVVLDASALLAFFQDEPGGDAVEGVIATSVISSVNWSEVIQKSVANAVDVTGMRDELQALGLTIIAFSADQAEIAGCLWPQTQHKGLSLADRACLATAQQMGIPVLTADRAWTELGLPLDIRVIR
jgi:PIN domain nuclease of toxin-antitoxin system